MTFQQAYHDTQDWKRRVYLIFMYHSTRKYQSKDWRVTDSANYFQIPISAVSEALTLNEHWEIVKNCKSKNEAILRLRNGKNVGTNETRDISGMDKTNS